MCCMHNEFGEKAGLGLPTEGIGSLLFYCLCRKTIYLLAVLMSMQEVRRKNRDIKLYDFQAGLLPGPPSLGKKTRDCMRGKKNKEL